MIAGFSPAQFQQGAGVLLGSEALVVYFSFLFVFNLLPFILHIYFLPLISFSQTWPRASFQLNRQLAIYIYHIYLNKMHRSVVVLASLPQSDVLFRQTFVAFARRFVMTS